MVLSPTTRGESRLSSDATLRHPGAVNSVHHSGSIVFRPLGVLTFRGRMLFCVVIAYPLAVRIKHDREVGRDRPRLWKQNLSAFPGLELHSPYMQPFNVQGTKPCF